MRLLLDTHAGLWWLTDDPRLSEAARQAIEGAASVHWSVASSWEVAIKIGLGRLDLPRPLEPFLTRHLHASGLQVLAIEHRHACTVLGLPLLHCDPFDRLLIAQALLEELILVTRDAMVSRYPIQTLW
jgi:PIN domain nuclease of toxin-antitoxin system